MADQPDADDQGRVGDRLYVTSTYFQAWIQRIESQGRQMDELLALLWGQVAPTPSPSTLTVIPTTDVSAAMPQATPSAPTVSAIPVPPITTMVPVQATIVAPTYNDSDVHLTAEFRWTREYEKYRPKKFSGGHNLDEVEAYILSHEKIQKLLRIEESLYREFEQTRERLHDACRCGIGIERVKFGIKFLEVGGMTNMPPSRYLHRTYDWRDHWSLSTSRSRCFWRCYASLEFLSCLIRDPFNSHHLCAFILFVKLVGDSEEDVVAKEV
ncbi:hypothetical protein Scep_027740 [Stephania cephalantha]|uniref:WDR11 first beta-propeller domain-containing protein n=1 Tax=Stephania cephalantha TaxID=152367 RepID=A0AAP0EG00_9MAGN